MSSFSVPFKAGLSYPLAKACLDEQSALAAAADTAADANACIVSAIWHTADSHLVPGQGSQVGCHQHGACHQHATCIALAVGLAQMNAHYCSTISCTSHQWQMHAAVYSSSSDVGSMNESKIYAI